MSLWVVVPALLLDRLLGEPKRWHPLVGFGTCAQRVEQTFNKHFHSNTYQRILGSVSVLLVVVPFVFLIWWLSLIPTLGILVDLIALYLALGARSLEEHAMHVHNALANNNLPLARTNIGMIVSRDTQALDESGVSKAAVESVLENGCDAIFGALFWFAIAGAPGVILYRLVNTLDAMWGYKTERFLYFGWAAARLDDVLNFVPARLTALSYALLGQFRSAIRCWREQAWQWKSPNAGPVMASGAGALRVQLGGFAIYHGVEQHRPPLGRGPAPITHDIYRAVLLVRNTIYLWVAILVCIAGVNQLA